MRTAFLTKMTAAFVAVPFMACAANWQDQPVKPEEFQESVAAAYEEDGRFFTSEDTPTFNVTEDGTVDWPTFSGFRRYHAECHVCHGPDGEGSTYAPKIKNSAVYMGYYDFYDVVVNGRKVGNSIMPHFGDNPNVMCYLDDIYSYLLARGMEAVPRGRPAKRPGNPKSSPRMKMLAWARPKTAVTVLVAALVLGGGAQAQTSDLVSRTAFRVCADPANYPMSSEDGRGYENKLAELFAEKLDLAVEYTWFPMATGFVRRTLREKRCDVIIAYAQGHELVQNTNHYFTSVYTLIVPTGSELTTVQSLSDPKLKGLRIGIIAGSPPATHLARNGLIGRAKAYNLFVDRRIESPAVDMLDDLGTKEIDAAILWGPLGGPLVKADYPDMTVIPLVKETLPPRLFYRITMGVRMGEKVWQRKLNSLIRRNQDEINALLHEAGVPLVNDMGDGLLEIAK